MKSSQNNYIFLPASYLIIWLMKAPKNFLKIVIVKTGELVSFWGAKTHFDKLPFEMMHFQPWKKKYFNQYYVLALDPIKIW